MTEAEMKKENKELKSDVEELKEIIDILHKENEGLFEMVKTAVDMGIESALKNK